MAWRAIQQAPKQLRRTVTDMVPTLTEILIAAGGAGSELDFSLLPSVGTPFAQLGLEIEPGTTFDQLDAMAKGTLFFCHPHAIPTDSPPSAFHRLWSPPAPWSTTSEWTRWRDSLEKLALSNPDDQHLPVLLSVADAALAWRASIPQELRFWPEGKKGSDQW